MIVAILLSTIGMDASVSYIRTCRTFVVSSLVADQCTPMVLARVIGRSIGLGSRSGRRDSLDYHFLVFSV